MNVVDVFAALADPVRRSIVERLADDGDVTAGELADQARERFGIAQPTASKHLKVLREAGLVHSRIDAQRRVYRLDPGPLDELADWAARQTRFWHTRLDALDRHLTTHPEDSDDQT